MNNLKNNLLRKVMNFNFDWKFPINQPSILIKN